MAKITKRFRPGALSELLRTKGMTRVDAAERTAVDRKTLLKIDRGGPAKQETLRQVANRLQVPENYFLEPRVAEVTGDDDVPPDTITIVLRKLDASRLEALLEGAHRIKWHLRAKVRDDEARRFLKDFETAVENFRKQHALISHGETDILSLRAQLDRLETHDDVATRLERFAVLHLALLGADYLFWKSDTEHGEHKSSVHYHSSRNVILSVEPGGTQSWRTPVFQGNLPPRFDPHTPDIAIYVNGEELPKLERQQHPIASAT